MPDERDASLEESERYFTWIRRVREILGKPSEHADAVGFAAMVNDMTWFAYYEGAMTPEQAVAEHKRMVTN